MVEFTRVLESPGTGQVKAPGMPGPAPARLTRAFLSASFGPHPRDPGSG